jgi:hypothetical protein
MPKIASSTIWLKFERLEGSTYSSGRDRFGPIASRYPRHINESLFVKDIADPSGVSAASLALQALAYQSGGIVLSSTKDVAGQIARCVSDSDSSYVLAFDSAPAAKY